MPVYNKAKKISNRSLRRKAEAEAVEAAEAASDSDNEAEAVVNEAPESADISEKKETILQFNEPAQWVERMALTAVKSLPADLNPDDDPKREEIFIQHTLLSVAKGLQMLEKCNVPWRRPKDYYAEMYKDDVHMNKIRESIVKSKQQVEERAHRRAMKDQKKFGKEVQAEVLRQRAKYKRDLNEKISDWKRKRRGNDEKLDDVLEDEDEGRGGKRARREGGGGARTQRPKNLKPGGSSKRPGKNARRRK